MKNLADKKCEPCEGGVLPMNPREIEEYLNELSGWRYEEGKIKKSFIYKNFKEAMVFVNKVADIAESEGHHPDIGIHYNKVDITLWTHAVGGLSQNDFILAAKIDPVRDSAGFAETKSE